MKRYLAILENQEHPDGALAGITIQAWPRCDRCRHWRAKSKPEESHTQRRKCLRVVAKMHGGWSSEEGQSETWAATEPDFACSLFETKAEA